MHFLVGNSVLVRHPGRHNSFSKEKQGWIFFEPPEWKKLKIFFTETFQIPPLSLLKSHLEVPKLIFKVLKKNIFLKKNMHFLVGNWVLTRTPSRHNSFSAKKTPKKVTFIEKYFFKKVFSKKFFYQFVVPTKVLSRPEKFFLVTTLWGCIWTFVVFSFPRSKASYPLYT